MNEQRYDVIDITKFIACICIVGIHTEVTSDFLGGYYYLCNGLFRLAVPFFFITSGFFYGIKTRKRDIEIYTCHYVKRLVIPLAFWECVNIVIEILKQYFIQDIAIQDILLNVIQSIVFYPYGALWYVQALIIAVLITSWGIKKNKLVHCVVSGLLLYLVGLLANTYYFVIAELPIHIAVDKYLDIFVSARNGIFVGLFFVSLGAMIGRNFEVCKKEFGRGWILIGSYALLIIELVITKQLKSADDKSMYISFVVLIPVLLIYLAKQTARIRSATLLRQYSAGIYFMHKAMIHVWLVLAMVVGIMLTHTIKFSLSLLGCLVACTLVYRIDNKYLNMILK